MPTAERSSSDFRVILKDAAIGNPGARDELLALATDRLRAITRMMLKNYSRLRRWEESDDVLQNAAIRLCRSLDELEPENARQFYGLAMTQIRRTLIDLVRHHFGPEGQGANHHTDTGSVREIDVATDQASQPENVMEWNRFHEAVETLPDEDQEAFSLVWYGGLSQIDAAEMLEISRRTMTRRMTRARLMIRDAMNGQWPRPGNE